VADKPASKTNSDSPSVGSTEVFCDLDQHGGGGPAAAGRRRSSAGTTHSLPTPRPPPADLHEPRPPRHQRHSRPSTTQTVAGTFRQTDTGHSPSRIDSSSLTPLPGKKMQSNVVYVYISRYSQVAK